MKKAEEWIGEMVSETMSGSDNDFVQIMRKFVPKIQQDAAKLDLPISCLPDEDALRGISELLTYISGGVWKAFQTGGSISGGEVFIGEPHVSANQLGTFKNFNDAKFVSAAPDAIRTLLDAVRMLQGILGDLCLDGQQERYNAGWEARSRHDQLVYKIKGSA